MESRIKLPKFCHKIGSCFDYVITESTTANIFTGTSILSHNRTMTFFNNESAVDERKNVIEHRSGCLPCINRSGESFFASPSMSSFLGSSEGVLKPYDETFVTASDFDHSMPRTTRSVFALFSLSDVKASLSIYDSSKISNIFGSLIRFINDAFCHMIPFVYNSIVINVYEIHAERLNKKTSFEDAIV